MLLAQSSEFLVKYDLHDGFAGYYQSPFFSQIYDLYDLVSTDHISAGRLLLLSGTPIENGQTTEDTEDNQIANINASSTEKCCIEVVNEESNTMVLKLVAST